MARSVRTPVGHLATYPQRTQRTLDETPSPLVEFGHRDGGIRSPTRNLLRQFGLSRFGGRRITEQGDLARAQGLAPVMPDRAGPRLSPYC